MMKQRPNYTALFPAVLLAVALLLVALLVLGASFTLLPAPPGPATPTWPRGIDLPDMLPHLTE